MWFQSQVSRLMNCLPGSVVNIFGLVSQFFDSKVASWVRLYIIHGWSVRSSCVSCHDSRTSIHANIDVWWPFKIHVALDAVYLFIITWSFLETTAFFGNPSAYVYFRNAMEVICIFFVWNRLLVRGLFVDVCPVCLFLLCWGFKIHVFRIDFWTWYLVT